MTEKEKILIVTGDLRERQILDQYLKEAHYRTKGVGSGESALELIGQENLAAVILDNSMPDLEGIEILCKALAIDSDLAVIMTTEINERLEGCRALEQGAYGYIIKPFHRNEVLVNVRHALLRKKMTMEKKRYISDLEGLAILRTHKIGEGSRLLHQKIRKKTGWEQSPSRNIPQPEFLSKKFKKHRLDLEQTFEEISGLILQATENKDFSVRFSNTGLPSCYELMNCNQKDCPCYGGGPQRCWQIAGTLCEGEIQGTFARKYASCSECVVYKDSTSTFRRRIGEEFNNMMHILERKNQDLVEACKALKKAHGQAGRGETFIPEETAEDIDAEIKSQLGSLLSTLNTVSEHIEEVDSFLATLRNILEMKGPDDVLAAFRTAWADHDIDSRRKDLSILLKQSVQDCSQIKSIAANCKISPK